MYSSLVFKMLIKPNQDQIELHTLLPMMEQNLVRSCFKMSSFCKIGWIDIFFHFFFCYSFAFRVFKCLFVLLQMLKRPIKIRLSEVCFKWSWIFLHPIMKQILVRSYTKWTLIIGWINIFFHSVWIVNCFKDIYFFNSKYC